MRELDKLIKPSLCADTLQVPPAVVDGIVRRFQEIPGYNATEFAPDARFYATHPS